MPDPAEYRRLDSWKEIASYLRRDVTTAIRWERSRGLPVHRVPGGKLSRVFAYEHELDEWLHRTEAENRKDKQFDASQEVTPTPTPSSPETPDHFEPPPVPLRRLKRSAVVAVATVAMLFVVVLAAALPWRLRTPDPTTLVLAGNLLVAKDRDGNQLWEHTFEKAPVAPSGGGWLETRDIDGDGAVDPLAAVSLKPYPSSATVDRLYRFSSDGRLQWSYEAADTVTFAAGVYGPPWANGHVAAFRSPRGPRILWSVHHYTWWPGLLITLDDRGSRVGTFVNSGWITLGVGTPDGRHIIALGMSNAHRSYFMAVLDAAQPSGRSPEPPGSTECRSCPSEGPLQYYVFPRTDVGGQFAYPVGPPGFVILPGGALQVHVLDSPGPAFGATIYEFGADFRIRDVLVNDSFGEAHRKLEASRALSHALAECPDRRQREVRHWTREAGWQAVRFAVK